MPLRRNDASQQAGDVEAQAPAKGLGGHPGKSHNPVFLAKAIFRKVVTLLVSSDEGDITQPAGIVTMLRDIVIGIIFGVICISISIFLDHHNIIHLQSAHVFRDAAFNLLNDPETIATLEESSDMKFMTTRDYEAWRLEIDGADEKLADWGSILEKRTKEADDKRKEVDAIKGEHEELKNKAKSLGIKTK